MTGEVIVNARSLRRPITGVERYTAAVVTRLADRVRVIRQPVLRRRWFGHLWEQMMLPKEVAGADLLWSPANTGPLVVTRQVLTIHDLSVFDHPENFTPSFRFWYRRLLPLLANRVEKIITDSEFSRVQICQRFGLPSEKVIAIYCGVDQSHFYPRSAGEIARVRNLYQLPDSYFLVVGSLDPRKNLGRLIKAWRRIENSKAHPSLVIAGRANGPFRSLKLDPLPSTVKLIGYVDEDHLPALYSGSRGLLMPSVYEGFGLPVLEAMACNTPAIVSKIPALEEAAGNAGYYFDPHNIGDLVRAIRTIESDQALREYLISLGLTRVNGFPWEQTAKKVWEVLKELGARA